MCTDGGYFGERRRRVIAIICLIAAAWLTLDTVMSGSIAGGWKTGREKAIAAAPHPMHEEVRVVWTKNHRTGALGPLWTSKELLEQTDDDARRLQEAIHKLQNPPDCKTAKLLFYNYWGYGLGSEVHGMSLGLTAALFSGRTLVLHRDSWRTFGDEVCGDSQFSCYWMPLSKCSMDDVTGEMEEFHQDPSNVRVQNMHGGTYFGGKLGGLDQKPGEGYTHRSNLWWRSQLLAYLLRPNEATGRMVISEWEREKLGRLEKFTAMHVRHGGKGSEAALIPMPKYIERLRAWRDQVDGACNASAAGNETLRRACAYPKKVVLSTEDDQVINDTAKYSDFEWSWTINPRSNQDMWQPHLTNNAPFSPKEQAHIALKNLYLALGADHIICTLSSNWGRLLLELSIALHGTEAVNTHHYSVFSMDREWFVWP